MIVMRHKNYAQAFTLIEILVVISILGLLASIVFAVIRQARERGVIAGGIIFATHTQHTVGDQGAIYFDFGAPSDLDADPDTEEVADTSGNSLHGTLMGNSPSNPMVSPTSYSPEAGSSLSLNTQSGIPTQYVSVGSSPALESEKLILSAWVKSPPVPHLSQFIKTVVSYHPVYILFLDLRRHRVSVCTTPHRLYSGPPGSCLSSEIISIDPVDDKWHNIIVSIDSGVPNGSKIYYDGRLIAQGLFNMAAVPSGCEPILSIGKVEAACGIPSFAYPDNTYPNMFTGQLDDVRVYTTSLPVN